LRIHRRDPRCRRRRLRGVTMPEVTHTTHVAAPVDRVWDFVRDMNNWAPLLTGYQSHEVKDERRSVWTLRGDVGILSRTVQLDVYITEWAGPDRVSFTLKGLNEVVEGGGPPPS